MPLLLLWKNCLAALGITLQFNVFIANLLSVRFLAIVSIQYSCHIYVTSSWKYSSKLERARIVCEPGGLTMEVLSIRSKKCSNQQWSVQWLLQHNSYLIAIGDCLSAAIFNPSYQIYPHKKQRRS
jgi:hypothetical protein